MKNGLVIKDMGGAFCFILVDSVRWKQIEKIKDKEEYHDMLEFVQALTYVGDYLPWPEDCPKPKGKILKKWYSEFGSISKVKDIVGILLMSS